MQADSQITCKNCGQTAEGTYCKHCGQKTAIGRINLSNFLKEVSESIFQVDKGLFYTMKSLMTNPGEAVQEFLEGKRKKHFKPIGYVLTLSTFYFLVTQLTHQSTWVDDAITGWMSGATEQSTKEDISPIAVWFAQNYAYTTLIFLPLYSLASYLSFLKFDKNYLEHLVINSYITGQQAVLYAVFALIMSFIEWEELEFLPLLVAVIYTFWVYWQFFSAGNRISILLRSGLTYLLYLVIILVFLLVLVAIHEFS